MGAGEGARVDCFELEVGAGLDGGEVLFFDEDTCDVGISFQCLLGDHAYLLEVFCNDLPLPIMATPMG